MQVCTFLLCCISENFTNLGLLSYLQDKRNLEFNPRLGRAVPNDDCVEIVRFRPPYAPRLGKKSVDNFSPRLGRHCSGKNSYSYFTMFGRHFFVFRVC